MRIRAALGAFACAALVAACGGAGSKPKSGANTRYGPANSPYAMSKCMRANGLSNFPDPRQGSGGVGFPGGVTLASNGELTVDGVSFSGPALKHAEAVCKQFLPGGAGPPPAPSERQRQAALRVARCMRANGVPNFPDPPSGASAQTHHTPLPDPSSPAFQNAVKVCSKTTGIRLQGSRVTIGGP
jgi:hypothetical protein